MIITIYSKQDYVQCNTTYLTLKFNNLFYYVVGLTKNHEALCFVINLGYQQLLIIIANKSIGQIFD
ncbi:MAG: NrdH-redoxin [Arsenophonus sp. ET-YP4-MAG3]